MIERHVAFLYTVIDKKKKKEERRKEKTKIFIWFWSKTEKKTGKKFSFCSVTSHRFEKKKQTKEIFVCLS